MAFLPMDSTVFCILPHLSLSLSAPIPAETPDHPSSSARTPVSPLLPSRLSPHQRQRQLSISRPRLLHVEHGPPRSERFENRGGFPRGNQMSIFQVKRHSYRGQSHPSMIWLPIPLPATPSVLGTFPIPHPFTNFPIPPTLTPPDRSEYSPGILGHPTAAQFYVDVDTKKIVFLRERLKDWLRKVFPSSQQGRFWDLTERRRPECVPRQFK